MEGVTVEISGTYKQLARRVKRFHARMSGDLLNRIAQRIAKQTRYRVKREKKAPDGTRWAARKDDKPHPLLEDTGRMLGAIKATRKSKTLIHVGTDVLYDSFHQKGTKRMEARPLYGLSDANMEDLESLVDAWVEKFPP